MGEVIFVMVFMVMFFVILLWDFNFSKKCLHCKKKLKYIDRSSPYRKDWYCVDCRKNIPKTIFERVETIEKTLQDIKEGLKR